MMIEKILACPYCGNELLETYDDGESYYVFCSSCGSQGPLAKDKNDAILLWNAAANALHKKDEEIARLTAALADTEQQRHETVSKLSMALIRETAGKRRQDELEAEIARLTAACDDLEGEYLRMKDERDELEAEIARLTAACDDLEGEYLRMKEHSENLMLRINQLEEYKEIWYKRAMESLDQRDKALVTRDAAVSKISEMRTMWIDDVKRLQDRNGILLNQRDEARKVARVWYNVAGVWKEKAEANDIDKIEDELMEYCKQQQARKVIYWVDGTNETTRTEPQTIRVETTDKETP